MPARTTPRPPLRLLAAAAALLAPAGAARAEEGPVRFGTEVMAVLSKAGCNQGACHGNLNGKGGFKLSLRGEAPDLDLMALTRGQIGRRLNLEQPEQSLILQKVTGRVPHEGGQRFTTSSPEYALLSRWLEQGARADPPQQKLAKLVIEPRELFLLEPAHEVRVRAWAVFEGG